MLKTVLFCVVWNVQIQAHNPKNLGTQATHGQSNYMAQVALDGTINMQGTKEIDRTNLAQLREPATNDRGDCGRTAACRRSMPKHPSFLRSRTSLTQGGACGGNASGWWHCGEVAIDKRSTYVAKNSETAGF